MDNIQDILSRIKTRNFQSVINRIENGQDLRLLKETVPHGGWLDLLLSSKVGYESVRTIQRDMRLAEALYPRLEELESQIDDLSWSSLLELVQKDAPESTIDFALAMKEQGTRITAEQAKKIAFIANYGWLRDKVENGAESLDSAYSIAVAIAQTPAIEPLAHAGALGKTLTALAQAPDHLLNELIATRAIYNPAIDKTIPIADVSASDVEAYLNYESSERFARHVQHINDWKQQKQTRNKLAFKGTWADVKEHLEACGFTPDQLLDVLVFIPENDKLDAFEGYR